MKFKLFIAKRYLFAKKSHNVINIISLISAIGIAIGTAALIIILSVYNGFEHLVKEIYSNHEPDILILPSSGKTFYPTSEQFAQIMEHPSIEVFAPIIEENLFVKYGESEAVATIKGVDENFAKITPIKEFITEGEFKLYHGELPQVMMGRSLAYTLGLRVHFVAPVELYFPSRHRPLSMVNPSASLNREKLFPGGLFSLDQEFDKKYMIIPIELARDLLEYEEEVTSVELFLKEGEKMEQLAKEFATLLGSDYRVLDRYRQNETLYKMMRAEKLSIYIILFFVMLIISCNLLSSLAMLIIEKREDSQTLLALGAERETIRQIFILEGWLISLLGMATGALLGVTIALIQQYFGVVPMPGNFIVHSYPVIIKWSDLLFTIIGVSLIGLVTSLIPLGYSHHLSKK